MAARRAKAASRGRGAKSSADNVDFAGVEGSRRVPDGDYSVKSVEVERREGDEAPYYNWQLVITDGEHANKKLYHTTSLKEAALWNLRATLEAAGVSVPDGPMKFTRKGDRLPDLEGLEFGVSVENETYQGKKKPRVVDVFSLDEFEGGADNEEEYEEVEEEEPETEEEETEEEEDGETEEVEEEEEVELGVDSPVVFTWEGEQYSGTISAVGDESYTIVDEEGYEYEVEAVEVFPAEEV